MKYYAIIDDDGNHIESGFCPNNCDIVTALGREIKTGERYVVGKGHDEDTAIQDSKESLPVEI